MQPPARPGERPDGDGQPEGDQPVEQGAQHCLVRRHTGQDEDRREPGLDEAQAAGCDGDQRETDVLRLLQGSLSLNEIASHLYVSHNTVKTHTSALYRKLGARSRAEAVQIGRSRQLV